MYCHGNNYQMIGKWKGNKGTSYFGYAETLQEAQSMIDLFSSRADLSHINKWLIRKVKTDTLITYKPNIMKGIN